MLLNIAVYCLNEEDVINTEIDKIKSIVPIDSNKLNNIIISKDDKVNIALITDWNYLHIYRGHHKLYKVVQMLESGELSEKDIDIEMNAVTLDKLDFLRKLRFIEFVTSELEKYEQKFDSKEFLFFDVEFFSDVPELFEQDSIVKHHVLRYGYINSECGHVSVYDVDIEYDFVDRETKVINIVHSDEEYYDYGKLVERKLLGSGDTPIEPDNFELTILENLDPQSVVIDAVEW